MKKQYSEPKCEYVLLSCEDVLTASGDNDAPFIKSDKLVDSGWSQFY